MSTTVDQEVTTNAALDEEALFREARQRERRRRLVWLTAVLVAVGGGIALGVGVSRTGPAARHRVTVSSTSRSPAAPSVPTVSPKRPAALAVAPNGDLYLIDSTRDQILRRLPSGKFALVAGTGRDGDAGDGGPAIDAKLRLASDSGLAIARNGTVYFSDSGNNEVRAILPNGTIETIAGGGTVGLPATPGASVPARSAALGGVSGLAIGPDRELYIAASFIVRLSASERLFWVAGSARDGALCWTRGCPVGENHFDNAGAIAFDGHGNLIVASDDFAYYAYGLGEVTTTGRTEMIGGCRGTGGRACALTALPDGGVLADAFGRFYRIANGSDLEQSVMAQDVVKLSNALAIVADEPATQAPFFSGFGVVVTSNGTIYADAEPNASGTPYAIVELTTARRVRVIWFRDWWRASRS